MKKQSFIIPVMILVVLVGLSSLTFFNNQPTEVRTVDMPDNVKAVVDTKCFGCHNVESTNDKAKDKLLWDKLDDLSKAEFVSALGSIEEVLDEDEMPPAKFLEKKPEMKLTADEKMVLRDWAVATAEKMME